MEETTKMCAGPCGEDKPLDAYYRHKNGKFGRTSKCKACMKYLYVDPNQEAIDRRVAEWSKTNREEINKRSAEWKRNNPDKVNESNARRRAKKRQVTIEKVSYKTIRHRDHTCYLCSVPFTYEERYSPLTQVDHKIPISKGGEHSYANCALTHGRCNLSKCDKTPEEYWSTLLDS